MDDRVQRRVQRYGWDLASADYESLWQAQLAPAQRALLEMAAPKPGEHVLDVACGTGLVALDAAAAVAPDGCVLGVDLSDRMVEASRRGAAERQLSNTRFLRMDAESLTLSNGSFDVALCALGLMYMPDPRRAVREMHRVLRPGGRAALAVWGDRSNCGWSSVFPIVDAEVSSDVCPLFFRLGWQDALARTCESVGFKEVMQRRLTTVLRYADADEACEAAFVGGPVAMAWSRFDQAIRIRARARYVESIAQWKRQGGYELPGEFVVVCGIAAH